MGSPGVEWPNDGMADVSRRSMVTAVMSRVFAVVRAAKNALMWATRVKAKALDVYNILLSVSR